jgi:hypothetical protein
MSRENKTLLTCLQALDKSDIFIGYMGARYGSSNLVCKPSSPGAPTWIDENVALCADAFPHIAAYKDRSITEMEFQHAFLHGSFASDPAKPLCFFFFRSPAYDDAQCEAAVAKTMAAATVTSLLPQQPDTGTPATASCESRKYVTENAASAAAAAALRASVAALTAETGPPASRFGCTVEGYADPEQGAGLMVRCCEELLGALLRDQSLPDLADASEDYRDHMMLCFQKRELFTDFGGSAQAVLSWAERHPLDAPSHPLIVTGETDI